jgi:putative membrane protein
MFGVAGGDGLPMMYDGDGWMWGGWILMTLVMVVFWSLVITAIVLAIRYLTGGGDPNQVSPSSARAAEDVLAERFARGEIDDDEYRQRMTTLRAHR